jgi:hypothetical protein
LEVYCFKVAADVLNLHTLQDIVFEMKETHQKQIAHLEAIRRDQEKTLRLQEDIRQKQEEAQRAQDEVRRADEEARRRQEENRDWGNLLS